MLKKLTQVVLIFFMLAGATSAREIPIKISAGHKISTSTGKMQEGDTLTLQTTQDFYQGGTLYIKKGSPVSGLITSLVDNDFTCQEASIFAENFKVKNVNGKDVKLKGIVYKKGRNHWMYTQFLPGIYVFIRGGEAQILPQKDIFTLYLESGDD